MSSLTALPRRRLGRSELRASIVGAGCWPIGGPDHNLGLPMGWGAVDAHEARRALDAYLEAGVNLFDTADVYGHGRSERLIGEMVASADRSELILTSKVGYFAGTASHAYAPTHMRHQLEQSLENLGTDHLDIYFLHNDSYGPNDRHLARAIDAMHGFKAEGLIHAIGMRGPHRYAPDRLVRDGSGVDKAARFETLFHQIRPEILAVRDNLLTPAQKGASIYSVADSFDCGVLINKTLSQGLLTSASLTSQPRAYADGDHRARKGWFQPSERAIIAAGLRRVQRVLGSTDEQALIQVALWYCLGRSNLAVALCGFTNAAQAAMNARAGLSAFSPDMVAEVYNVMSGVQVELDARGEVFVDEAGSS